MKKRSTKHYIENYRSDHLWAEYPSFTDKSLTHLQHG